VIFTVDLRVRYILDLWTAPLALLAVIAALVLPHPAYPTFLSVLGRWRHRLRPLQPLSMASACCSFISRPLAWAMSSSLYC